MECCTRSAITNLYVIAFHLERDFGHRFDVDASFLLFAEASRQFALLDALDVSPPTDSMLIAHRRERGLFFGSP